MGQGEEPGEPGYTTLKKHSLHRKPNNRAGRSLQDTDVCAQWRGGPSAGPEGLEGRMGRLSDTDTPPHARDEKSGFHHYHCNTASTQPCRQSTGPPAPKPKIITVREARGDLLSFLSFPLFIFPLWVWGPKEMLGSHLGELANLWSKPNKGDEASPGRPRGGVNGNEGVEFV